MEVFVSSPTFSFSNSVFPDGSLVRDILNRFVQQQGFPSDDFYVVSNGRLSHLDDPLQHGAVYRMEPRLCGGKGGFGSMLRALGAQIEKTTNREACRDLSGRRLRDVNHEKEMAEWLKKQTEREAEKEQRRLERLQRKLAEPKHQFTDSEYQRQCHDLSERLEDSVIKGLQASSSSQVRVDDVSPTKRPNQSTDQCEQPPQKKKKKTTAAAACFWMGVDDVLSSDDDDDEDEDDGSPSSSSSSHYGAAAAATTTTQMEEGTSQPSSSSSSAHQTVRPAEHQGPPQRARDQTVRQSEDQRGPETSRDETAGPSEEPKAPKTTTLRPSEDQSGPETSRDQTVGPSEDQRAPEIITVRPSEDQKSPEITTVRPSEDQRPPEITTVRPPEDQKAPETSGDRAVTSSEDQRGPEESSQLSQQQGPSLDLSSLSSVQQLESLGLDVLKKELMSRGLKCGGTLTERAHRLFSVRGLAPGQIDAALLAKPAKSKRK